MTTALDPVAARPLAPVNATLRAMFGTDTALPGLAPGLTVDDRAGWLTATDLLDRHMPQLLAAARRRWEAQPHAAAALAWKTYTYWLALPAVLGWGSARRGALVTAGQRLIAL